MVNNAVALLRALYGSSNRLDVWIPAYGQFVPIWENDKNRPTGLLTFVSLSSEHQKSQNPELGQMSHCHNI